MKEKFLKKFKIKQGDFVLLSSGEKGTIIPGNKKEFLNLKLDSGYNIGVKIDSKLKAKKIAKGKKVGKPKAEKIAKKPGLPTIAILHTGGTIASRVDYTTGAVYAGFSPQDLNAMFPELKEKANIETELISNMMSEDMEFKNYSKTAKAIAKHAKKGVKGIILGHGTDTLHYTSAALSFMLEDIDIPVLLVGAQRSSDRGSSDAAVNILSAANFILKTDFAGVGICMHESMQDNSCIILSGCKARKFHTSRRDAFKAVNDLPIARVKYPSGEIEYLKEYRKKNGKNLKVKDKMEEKVALLKTHTNMNPKQFLFYKKYKGLVIEGTGLGHTPIGKNESIIKAINSLTKSGTIAVITSQTIFGRIQMHVYSNQLKLSKAGVISGEDMTAETAFIKLAWLLGNYPKGKVKELIGKNLCGEITERTRIDSFPKPIEKLSE